MNSIYQQQTDRPTFNILGLNVLIFDIEIKNAIPDKSFRRLPGIEYCNHWGDYLGMGISVIGYQVNDQPPDCVTTVQEFREIIDSFDGVIVGFNSRKFDATLLHHHGLTLDSARHYDLLQQVRAAARLSGGNGVKGRKYDLNFIAQANGLAGKTAAGSSAPILWQQGHQQRVIDYCKNDIKMTAEILKRGVCGELVDPNTGDLLKVQPPTSALVAINADGNTSRSSSQVRVCPWNNKANDFDQWSIPVTDWQLSWQSKVPEKNRGVAIGIHKPGILLESGLAIELIDYDLPPAVVSAKEKFYDDMFWFVDARAMIDDFYQTTSDGRRISILDAVLTDFNRPHRIPPDIKLGHGNEAFSRFKATPVNGFRFDWDDKGSSLLRCKKSVFFDFGGCNLLRVRFDKKPYDGWTENTRIGSIIPKSWATELFADENEGIRTLYYSSHRYSLPPGCTVYGDKGIPATFIGYQQDSRNATIETVDGAIRQVDVLKIKKWKYQPGVKLQWITETFEGAEDWADSDWLDVCIGVSAISKKPLLFKIDYIVGNTSGEYADIVKLEYIFPRTCKKIYAEDDLEDLRYLVAEVLTINPREVYLDGYQQ